MSTQQRLEALYAVKARIANDLRFVAVGAPIYDTLREEQARNLRRIAMLTEADRKPTPMPVQPRAKW